MNNMNKIDHKNSAVMRYISLGNYHPILHPVFCCCERPLLLVLCVDIIVTILHTSNIIYFYIKPRKRDYLQDHTKKKKYATHFGSLQIQARHRARSPRPAIHRPEIVLSFAAPRERSGEYPAVSLRYLHPGVAPDPEPGVRREGRGCRFGAELRAERRVSF